jgi:hypothetical protein
MYALHPDKLIRIAHSMIGTGIFSECSKEIPKGHCTCCLFDTGLSNWIGLGPSECTFLKQTGSTYNWKYIEKGQVEGIICARQGFNCDNKPLDCKLYPYWPYQFSEKNEHFTVIELLAGFPKCPLGHSLKSLSNQTLDETLEQFQENSALQHLFRVAKIGIFLFTHSMAEYFKKTGEDFNGYDMKFRVKVSHENQKSFEEPYIKN